MSGSAQPGTGIQAGQNFGTQRYPVLRNGSEMQGGGELNPLIRSAPIGPQPEPDAANVFFPQLNAQLPQGMPNYQQLMQQNMLQGQQRIQNVPNVRGFFGGGK